MPLSQPFRIFWVFSNLALGLLPSLAFLAWVERNASLPWIGLELGWPWLSLQSWPTLGLCAWNASLFLSFGILHSLTAQASAQKILRRLLPEQAVRSFYVVLTGLSLLAVMGLWQNTGEVLWAIGSNPAWVSGISFALYWSLLAAGAWVLRKLDPLEFLGFRQIYAKPGGKNDADGVKLQTTGLYGIIRHPLYGFMLLAFWVAPFMTLDRALLAAAALVYLVFAIPLEERKLVEQFGSLYSDYRARVPALFPLGSSKRPGAATK